MDNEATKDALDDAVSLDALLGWEDDDAENDWVECPYCGALMYWLDDYCPSCGEG